LSISIDTWLEPSSSGELTAAIELVITRQLGISRRMFGTPTTIGTIILGESLGRIAFALVQGAFIVLVSALLFGVDWGNPLLVAAVVAVFALVAGGASMVIGTVAANPSQAGALGPALVLLLGLLGGAMVPLEVFPETMRTIARLTPHAWAMEALSRATSAGAGVADILPQLAVLAGFAAVFFGIAALRFRRVLVGAG
jgi:ABC-2 type transport system permease protein